MEILAVGERELGPGQFQLAAANAFAHQRGARGIGDKDEKPFIMINGGGIILEIVVVKAA